jgi:hypothetical protein
MGIVNNSININNTNNCFTPQTIEHNDEYLVPEETTEEFTPFDYSQVNLKMFDGWL